jgi:hypothetical protein
MDRAMSELLESSLEMPRSSIAAAPTVEDRLAKLRRDLDHLSAESKNWVKTWGVYLGILGALIAVPKGALDLMTQLYPRPETSVMIKSVKITHVPKLQPEISEIVEFPLVVMNLGNRDDALLGRSAKLTGPGETVNLSDDDFGLYENGTKVEVPLLVTKATLRAYDVSVTFSPKARQLAATPGVHKLELFFPGVNKSYSSVLCFTLNNSDVENLFESDRVETQNFDPKCTKKGDL